jgi:DNA-directed RNA polymerase subunit RPC12/RpoP
MTARIGSSDSGGVGSSNGILGRIFESTSSDGSLVKYYRMNCGSKHKQVACPKCGSKIKSWFLELM